MSYESQEPEQGAAETELEDALASARAVEVPAEGSSDVDVDAPAAEASDEAAADEVTESAEESAEPVEDVDPLARAHAVAPVQLSCAAW